MKYLIIALGLGLSGCNLTGLQVAGALASGYNESKEDYKTSDKDNRCTNEGYIARQRVINNQLIAGVKYINYSLAGEAFRVHYELCMLRE